jgi:chloramphenicol 3-O phosphotransferase
MSTELPSTGTDLPDVIVLNGPSSSGKTNLAAALQDILEDSWLVFGIDTLISALPLALLEIHDAAVIEVRPRDHAVRDGGISFDAHGAVTVGAEFQRLEAAWLKGLSTIAGDGVHLILDAVFLAGAVSQDRVRKAFAGRRIAWIGVTCDPDTRNQRERERGDRVLGTSQQARHIHEDVDYDLVVDTTSRSPAEVSREMVAFLFTPAV